MTTGAATNAKTISGEGSLAVVFGGFGFTNRQLSKHEALYTQHGFEVVPVLYPITQMISPEKALRNGTEVAERLMEADKNVVIHAISGSTWTLLYALNAMEKSWRDKRVRAIMFDSCPPQTDVYAFGGWLSWFCQAKFGIPAAKSKPLLAQLFHPVRLLFTHLLFTHLLFTLSVHTACRL